MSTLPRAPELDANVIVPLRSESVDAVPPVTAARSTLLSASLLAIARRGLSERYFAALPSPLHEPIRSLVAGGWAPIELAMAHYGALDALELSHSQQFEMGAEVGERIQKGLLGLAFRLAKTSGVTPWAGISMFAKLMDASFQGGDARIVKLGPKEARFETYGLPLVRYEYFRNAWRGLTSSGIETFCSRAFVKEEPGATSSSFRCRASWA